MFFASNGEFRVRYISGQKLLAKTLMFSQPLGQEAGMVPAGIVTDFQYLFSVV